MDSTSMKKPIPARNVTHNVKDVLIEMTVHYALYRITHLFSLLCVNVSARLSMEMKMGKLSV